MITLELLDPLAEVLGARAPGEPFRYTFEDAEKLSGHSCPTVAGAFLQTVVALRALYPDGTPVRGNIEVTLGGPPTDNALGPMSQVIALLTGAAPETGFAGLMGHFRRRGLLRFDPALGGRIRFRRVDTGDSVETEYDPRAVPPSPKMPELLTAVLSGRATPAEAKQFAELWQARVRDILNGDPERVVHLRRGGG